MSNILKILRTVFGIFMVIVYLGMSALLILNYFGWSETTGWKTARWAMAIVFGAYGLYRCYRQIKGTDYYDHRRVRDEEQYSSYSKTENDESN